MARLEDLIRIVSLRTERHRAYAEWVVAQYAFIGLGGLDPTRPDPLRLPLSDLYVPLKGRRARKAGDEASGLPLGGRQLGARAVAERFGQPERVIELLRQRKGASSCSAIPELARLSSYAIWRSRVAAPC